MHCNTSTLCQLDVVEWDHKDWLFQDLILVQWHRDCLLLISLTLPKSKDITAISSHPAPLRGWSPACHVQGAEQFVLVPLKWALPPACLSSRDFISWQPSPTQSQAYTRLKSNGLSNINLSIITTCQGFVEPFHRSHFVLFWTKLPM